MGWVDLAQHNCGTCHFFSATFSSQLESMVGGAMSSSSALRVGLGVGSGAGTFARGLLTFALVST